MRRILLLVLLVGCTGDDSTPAPIFPADGGTADAATEGVATTPPLPDRDVAPPP